MRNRWVSSKLIWFIVFWICIWQPQVVSSRLQNVLPKTNSTHGRIEGLSSSSQSHLLKRTGVCYAPYSLCEVVPDYCCLTGDYCCYTEYNEPFCCISGYFCCNYQCFEEGWDCCEGGGACPIGYECMLQDNEVVCCPNGDCGSNDIASPTTVGGATTTVVQAVTVASTVTTAASSSDSSGSASDGWIGGVAGGVGGAIVVTVCGWFTYWYRTRKDRKKNPQQNLIPLYPPKYHLVA